MKKILAIMMMMGFLISGIQVAQAYGTRIVAYRTTPTTTRTLSRTRVQNVRRAPNKAYYNNGYYNQASCWVPGYYSPFPPYTFYRGYYAPCGGGLY